MKLIEQRTIKNSRVNVPGSKSISHRMIIMASLCQGESTISNVLNSQDILLTISCLENMGARIVQSENKEKSPSMVKVTGFNGQPARYPREIYLGNSGTSMRLLAGIAALGTSDYVLTGDNRMCQRPMTPLIDALTMANVAVSSKSGTPPVIINGKHKRGGKIKIDLSLSSQYLSSLLITGCYMAEGLEITITADAVSQPYIDLTIAIMKLFNVYVEKTEKGQYIVRPGQKYQPGNFIVEPDISNAGYFWAAGAICRKKIKVLNVYKNSIQGDIKFVHILKQMGCDLMFEHDGIAVCGRKLRGVDVDMSDTPDAVPALAVTAAFASGCTLIKNIGHLREKECDRIEAVARELARMDIKVESGHDWIKIFGGKPRGAVIETYNDHRIAMAFSLAGLVTDNVFIKNENCVAKSFPTFWEVLQGL